MMNMMTVILTMMILEIIVFIISSANKIHYHTTDNIFFGFRTHMLFPHDTPEQDSVDRHLKLIKINMLEVNMIMIMTLDRHSPNITIGQTLKPSPSLNN